ncbi:U3 snoRNP protein, partial [Coemansia nantahalensis]
MAAAKRKAGGGSLPAAKHSATKAAPAAAAAESDADMASSDEDGSAAGGSDEEMADGDEEPAASVNNDGSGADAAAAGAEHKKRTGARATNAEVMALNEASMLFKSNLFRLQIDELLGETLVAANTKETRGLDAALKQIRDVLMAAESTKELTMDAAANLVRKLGKGAAGAVTIPFPDPAPPAGLAVKVAFAAPETVNVAGSYPLGTAVRVHGGFNVDVVAQMPAQLLQERDHLNYRYFYKRAFYTAMLRVQLQRSALSELFDIDYALLRSDARLPVVVLRPKPDTKHLRRLDCTIRIVPTIAHDALPLHRLAPGRNNVRPSYIRETAGIAPDAAPADDDSGELPPTPQYNAAVVGDALLLTHLKYLFETAEMCAEFPRAAALLRIWRSQRAAAGRRVGAREVAGTRRLGGFVLTMALAWLVRSPRSGPGSGARLAASMNAHQLFKGAIEFLAVHDFAAHPAQFGDAADLAAFGAGGAAVLVDPSASTNLLAGVQPWELAELRIEACQTALDLSHHSEPQFDRVFLSAALADVTAKYDHVFRLDVDLAQLLAPHHGSGLDVARRLAELECGHSA